MFGFLLAQADSVADTATDLSTGTTQAEADAAAAAGGLIFGGLMIFWIIVMVISLVFFIWWIFLIVDLTKRDFPEKTTWLILMIVGLVLGFAWLIDIIYYFAVVKKNLGGSAQTAK